MDSFTAHQDKVRIAIIADIDPLSANVFADKLVPQDRTFDCIFCCGPFTQANEWSKSKEAEALAQADIASTIASLENVVCRVVYLPSEVDPPSTFQNQLHLTPNSVNVHARRMALRNNNLFVSGFTETNENLSPGRIINSEDKETHEYSDDEYDGVEVKSGASSIAVIEQIIKEGHSNEIAAREIENKSLSSDNLTGIFMLNYRFAHTLNHFLFHMPEILNKAGICIAVIPHFSTSGEAPRLPERFGNLTLITPPSLRLEGKHVELELELQDGKWNVASVVHGASA
jgi:hypothetical protein